MFQSCIIHHSESQASIKWINIFPHAKDPWSNFWEIGLVAARDLISINTKIQQNLPIKHKLSSSD